MRKLNRSSDVRHRVPVKVRFDAAEAVENHADDDTVMLSPDDSVLLHPHRLEQDVRNRLMEEPSLNFTSLVVRRLRDGLCLEGVLETDDDTDNVTSLVRSICGATQVLNHLVVHHAHELPRKG